MLRAPAPPKCFAVPQSRSKSPAGAAAPFVKDPPDRAPARTSGKDHTMGRITGDKGRFNKQRRQKIAKREEMRALRASWAGAAPAKPAKAKKAAAE